MGDRPEPMPEYVERSTILREVYGELPEVVRRELDTTFSDHDTRMLARVYVENRENRFNVYVLVYEVRDDGAEWITIVKPRSAVHFNVHDGMVWFNGRYYLPKNQDDVLRLAKKVLGKIVKLRNGDWMIATTAEKYVTEFKMRRGERLL